jgi:hypothetical protein
MPVLENAVQFRSFRRLINEEEEDLITQLSTTQFTSVQASNLPSALDIAVLSDAYLRLVRAKELVSSQSTYDESRRNPLVRAKHCSAPSHRERSIP